MNAPELANRLTAGLEVLHAPPERAQPADLAALLELYGRVASRSRQSRVEAGLEPAFQAMTQAWMKAGPGARTRAFQGLGTDELIERTHELSSQPQAQDEDVLGWAAQALRAALVIPWLEPADRTRVQEALAELVRLADTYPGTFLAASMLGGLMTEAEPVERWPKAAADLLQLFNRLPLLAVVDGEL